MNSLTKKIALIGAGNVGVSFLYSCMNRGLAEEYGIIDINDKLADGHVMDFEDASAAVEHFYKIKRISFEDLKDYSLIVITAGRPQKPGETRLNMVADNAKIMSKIAKGVKESGFKGITIVVANPVDIMTFIYQKETNFDKNKVISSGTSLDSARLRFALSQKLHVHPKSISAFVMGEHGDSSVSVYSSATISGKPFMKYVEEKVVSKDDLEKIHFAVFKKAYEIIDRKGSTYFGIGSTVAELAEAVLTNSHRIFAVGAYLTGQYGQKDLYIGVPAVISHKGIESIVEISLDSKELEKFTKSATVLKENIKKALEAIK